MSAHLDPLYRTALRLSEGRQADAEDLLQDALLKAFRHYHELRDAAAGHSWLFTIVMRTHLNRVRSSRRRHEEFAADLSEAEFEGALAEQRPFRLPDEAFDEALQRETIGRALDALAPELKVVALLVDAEGFSHREVASMLDLPPGTVASRLFRARRMLRGLLSPAAADRPTVEAKWRRP